MDSPLRQGDILICREPSTLNILEISLVVTADCDIANNKFGSSLACLRIISFQTYIRNIWAERKLDSLVSKRAAPLKDQLNKWNTKRLATSSNLSISSVVSWIKRCSAASICEELQVPTSDQPKLKISLEKFKKAIGEQDKLADKDNFSKLAAVNAQFTDTSLEKSIKDIAAQAKGQSLPEDIFFLPSLPQVAEEPYLVLLREIVAIPVGKIVFRATDATTLDHHLRIGRLKPTFKHAVSQSFGYLFSRIGMPESYETRRDTSMEQTYSQLEA